MAIALSLTTTIFNPTVDTDQAILEALSDNLTYTTIYGTSVIPISNTKAKVMVFYA